MAELERLDIPYNAELIESHLNIERCFEHGLFSPTEEGKQLLSFLLLASWNGLSFEIQERIRTNLLNQVVEKNGKKELVLRDYYIWISGNQKF